MYFIAVYIPTADLETVKNAMFSAGAGKIGEYDHCCWQVEGVGQYRPLENSNPSIGTRMQMSTEKEWRVEMVCEKSKIHEVITAMKQAHPYEVPAYQVLEMLAF